jgi:hypothetical protein
MMSFFKFGGQDGLGVRPLGHLGHYGASAALSHPAAPKPAPARPSACPPAAGNVVRDGDKADHEFKRF